MTADERIFRDMWAAGASVQEIAARFGICVATVHGYRFKYKLPKRLRSLERLPGDPTPDEIAERAAECREAHLAIRRGEPAENSWSRASQQRRRERLQA